MSQHPADFRVEIIKARPQGIETFELGPVPFGEVIDVTDYADLDGLGSVNRALERDLTSFKTGDVTMTFLNHAGVFDDLFAEVVFGPTTVWSLRIIRRGEMQFWGALIGLGSVTFDRLEKTVEVTAYGLTKILDRTSAELSQRIFHNPISNPYLVNANITAGVTNPITMNSGADDFLTGDTLHITDHANSDDVVVRQVLSGTSILLEAPPTHSYVVGDQVTPASPFYRFQGIEFLVRDLFRKAGVAVAEYRESPSAFATLAPTPVNLNGLPTLATTNPIYTCPAERLGREYTTRLVDGTYYQETPDAPWVQDDATLRAWNDWSPYYVQGDVGPTFNDRTPYTAESLPEESPHCCGWDSRGATHRLYVVIRSSGTLRYRESTDGTTWGAETSVPTFAIPGWNAGINVDVGCEFDPVRNQVLCWTGDAGAGGGPLQLYDVVGDSWTNCRQGDDGVTHRYGGFTYCRDLDCFIGLRMTDPGAASAVREIVAFRGSTMLWRRAFPFCATPALHQRRIFPTHSLRYVNGMLYCVVVSDGKAQFVWSGDQFLTYTMRTLTAVGTGARTFGGRVKGAYAIACYDGTVQKGLMWAAPFYAGVVLYADYTGLSVGEALKKLAILANALFWVDDDLQGHFVARDLYDPGAVVDIDDLVLEESEDLLWDQIARYVTISGAGFEATAGDAAFAAEGIELESSFIPNAAFCQALADSFFAFYSQARVFPEALLVDLDGHIYRPLDRVRRNGRVELVYESDHDLVADEVRVSRVENR